MNNISVFLKQAVGAVVLGVALLAPVAAHARVFLSVAVAPPPIPAYDQPLCPSDGSIWTPGYWAYGDQGYFWVDGAWVNAPYEGALWTPGYWGFENSAYVWNAGYWGNEVGYYGAINYGFGYFGTGFYGGYWNGGRFFYNRAYNHLDLGRVHNIDNTPTRGNFSNQPGGRAFDPQPPSGANRPGSHAGSGDGFRSTEGFHGTAIPPTHDDFRGTMHATAAEGFSGNRSNPTGGPQRQINEPAP